MLQTRVERLRERIADGVNTFSFSGKVMDFDIHIHRNEVCYLVILKRDVSKFISGTEECFEIYSDIYPSLFIPQSRIEDELSRNRIVEVTISKSSKKIRVGNMEYMEALSLHYTTI
jgi:hypothetical protein